jgi:myo-inositol catabolism protein IolS
MLYRTFGNTQFEISAISFGGASISGEGAGYGFGAISEADSITLLKQAFDLGINSFDTAPIYGFRTSEQRMGKAFKNIREKVFITSKCGINWHDSGRVDMDNDPKKAQRLLEQTLKDLQSDYVDLYMVHWPDSKWDIRYPLEILQNNQAKGKIKHIGLCNTNKNDLLKALDVCEVSALQSELNAFNQNFLELLDEFSDTNFGTMAWGTLDKGILTGRVNAKRQYDKFDCRKNAPWWKKDDVMAKVKKVEKLNMNEKDLLAMAIGHNLQTPKVSSAIVGARNPRQLKQVVNTLENLPDKEEIDEIVRRLHE